MITCSYRHPPASMEEGAQMLALNASKEPGHGKVVVVEVQGQPWWGRGIFCQETSGSWRQKDTLRLHEAVSWRLCVQVTLKRICLETRLLSPKHKTWAVAWVFSSLSMLVLRGHLHFALAQSSPPPVRDASLRAQIICPCDSRTRLTLTLMGDTSSSYHSFPRQSMWSFCQEVFFKQCLNPFSYSASPVRRHTWLLCQKIKAGGALLGSGNTARSSFLQSEDFGKWHIRSSMASGNSNGLQCTTAQV